MSLLSLCGVSRRFGAVMDSAVDVLPSVLRHLGRAPDSVEPAALEAAGRALLGIRPHLRSIPSPPALTEALANGEICLALT